jgi:spermidine synthase
VGLLQQLELRSDEPHSCRSTAVGGGRGGLLRELLQQLELRSDQAL